jgi:hypothetical protein
MNTSSEGQRQRFPFVVDGNLQLAPGVNPQESFSAQGTCITVENRGTHYAIGDSKNLTSPPILVAKRDFQMLRVAASSGELTVETLMDEPIELKHIRLEFDEAASDPHFPVKLSSTLGSQSPEGETAHYFSEEELAHFAASVAAGKFNDVTVPATLPEPVLLA